MQSFVAILSNIQVTGAVTASRTSSPAGDERSVATGSRSSAGTYVMDSFGVGMYRSVEYLIQVSQPDSNIHEVLRLLVNHNDTGVFFLEYGRVSTDSSGVEFSAYIDSGLIHVTYSQPAVLTKVSAVCSCLFS